MSDKTKIETGDTKSEVHIVADSLPVLQVALIEALQRVSEAMRSRMPAKVKESLGAAKLELKLSLPTNPDITAPTPGA